jgi:hypothetical protein
LLVIRLDIALLRLVENRIDLLRRESEDRNIKVERDQSLQLGREYLLVPAGVQGQLVVGQHICATLGWGEMGQAHNRHLVDAGQPCPLDPAMAGDDFVVVAYQYGIGEAEALDAVADLTNLRVGVRAGIAPRCCRSRTFMISILG